MGKKKKTNYSGIGGQAVIEGIMMRNQDKYSLACRKPDGEIEVTVNEIENSKSRKAINKIPFIRGIFAFVDSLSLGMDTLSASAEYFGGDEEETAFDRFLAKLFGKNAEKIVMGFTMVISLLLGIGIFILLPYFVSSLIEKYLFYAPLVAVVEGLMRLVIFIIYMAAISLMKDMRRVYMYHGAEHKCINCIERGKPLTVGNVMRSSRKHRRCGTSFLVLIMVITIILFFFIRIENGWDIGFIVIPAKLLKVGLRLLMIPVIAGISYEFLRLAGKYDNWFTRVISAPGMLLQSLTTREPDKEMAEVAIRAVEAVFDWKAYLKENFNYVDDDEEENNETSEEENTSAEPSIEADAEVEDPEKTKVLDTEEVEKALDESNSDDSNTVETITSDDEKQDENQDENQEVQETVNETQDSENVSQEETEEQTEEIVSEQATDTVEIQPEDLVKEEAVDDDEDEEDDDEEDDFDLDEILRMLDEQEGKK